MTHAGTALAKSPDMDFIANFNSPVPKVSELPFNPLDIAPMVEDKQLIITHKPRTIQAPGKNGDIETFENVIFITSLMLINKPVNEVRSIVTDYENYEKFMPRTERSGVVKQDEKRAILVTEVKFDTPIGKMDETLYLQYTQEDDGDITIALLKGAVDAALSRWQFLDAGNNRTLAVYTSWTDLGSSNFIVRAVLKSDPDLKRAAPIGLGAVVIEEFKKRAEGIAPKPKLEEMPSSPNMPTFALGKDIPVEKLIKLSEVGTLLFVHKAQWVNHPDEGEMEFIYVTAGSIINAGKEDVIALSIQFNRYNEFFHHVKDNDMYSESGDFRNKPFDVDWRLKIGLGVMKIGIDYRMHYTWLNDNSLQYDRTKGDIGHINGVWEYIPVTEDKTLMVITGVSKVGKDGSFILKLSNKIPNLEMISTIIAQALIVEKQKPWIEKQLENSQSSITADTRP